jgi:hypothetical protein
MALPSPAHAHPSYNDKNCGHLALPSCSDGTVGPGMPGVNTICNTKMSQAMADFELLLRQVFVRRNFQECPARRGQGLVRRAGRLRP